jgi:hypothetical protein
VIQREKPMLEALMEPDRDAIASRPDTSVSIVMGIDYKASRRRSAIQQRDRAGIRAFSSLQLAEWVVVVEALDQDGRCFAEFVYDASSSDEDPRVQFSRIFSAAVAVSPVNEIHPEASTFRTIRYPALCVPERVGKVDGL